MRWIITGSGGQLGRCLAEGLAAGSEPVLASYDHAALDIPDPETFMQLPWDKRIARMYCTLFRNREEKQDRAFNQQRLCR